MQILSFDELVYATKKKIEQKKKDFPFELLGRSLAYNNYPPRDVKEVLRSEKFFSLICEVNGQGFEKKEHLKDILSLAQDFDRAGVEALSVVTQSETFDANVESLTEVRRYVRVPLMQKDLILDKYQLLEALVYGADFVLIEANILSKKELVGLLEFSQRLDLGVLVNITSKEDLLKAIFSGANMLCINHRNLDTKELDFDLCEKLLPLIPNSKIIMAQGGIKEKSMMSYLHQIGIDGFLLSSFFLDKPDFNAILRELRR